MQESFQKTVLLFTQLSVNCILLESLPPIKLLPDKEVHVNTVNSLASMLYTAS